MNCKNNARVNTEHDHLLTELFISIIESEQNLEGIKRFLAQIEEFNIGDAISRIDSNNRGHVTSQDIKHFLKDNSVFFQDIYIQNFINFYQGNFKSMVSPHMSYHNFTNFILSKTEPDTNHEVLTRNSNRKVNSYLSYEIESCFAKLIEEEINLIRRISDLLDKFYQSKEFKIHSLLKRLAESNPNFINEKDIENFLVNSKEFDYTRLDCKLVLYRLDRDMDSEISYEDLKFLFKTHISDMSENLKTVNTPHVNVNVEVINKQNFQNFSNNLKEKEEKKEGKAQKHKTSKEKASSDKSYTSDKSCKAISIVKFVEDLLTLESNLEEIRKNLSLCNDIVITELFGLFDSISKKGKINKYSFQKTLNKFLIFPSNEDIDLVFSKYDKDEDSFLDYFEFSEIFMPNAKEYAKIMKNKLDNDNQIISQESKTLLIKFLKILINNEVLIETNRKKLCTKELFSAYQEFSNFKNINSNNADLDSLTQFIINNKIQVESESQFRLIFNRFDKDKDGKVTFSEFIQEISPLDLLFKNK